MAKLFKRKKIQESDDKQPSNLTRELGVDGDLVFESFSNEEKRLDKISIKEYRKMRNTDATVDMLFNIIKYPILSTTYGIKPVAEDEGEEQAKFIRNALFEPPHRGGMDTPFSLVLEQITHAVFEGFSLFERVYRYDDDGKLTLQKLARRDSTTVQLMRDKHGGYNGAHQKAQFGDKEIDVKLPSYKTFLFTYDKASDFLYGRSAFMPIYRNWDKKRKIEHFDSVAIQSKSIPPKILKRISDTIIKNTSSNGQIKNKALRMLAKLGEFNSSMSLPNGYDITELKGGDNAGIHESIERQNSEMAREFLANFMLAGSQGSQNVGSYNLSANQSDIFMLALRGMMNLIVEHINTYWIADLIDLNFPKGKRYYPTFYFDDMTDSTIKFLQTIFTKLVEKDRVSDEVVAGIEKQVVSRLEIDVDDIARDDDEGEAANEKTQVKSGESCLSPDSESEKVRSKSGDKSQTPDSAPAKKEENGQSASKFRREANEYEEKVNWDSIKKFREKTESEFEKLATPILTDYLDRVAQNPDDEIELPADYVKLLSVTYRNSYNYGKLSASDEEGEKAPKTNKMADEHVARYVDFIAKKQTDDIKNMVAAEKLKLPVEVFEKKVAADENEDSLAALIMAAAAIWIVQAIIGTRGTIFNDGMNAGRADAYAMFEEELTAVYMWSSILEMNTCPTCEMLDESIVSYPEMRTSMYQPGDVHINCHCMWVRLSGDNKPNATGFPDNLDEVNHMQTTTKGELQKEGLVGKDQTKADALRAKQYNKISNGKTLSEVEDATRNKSIEYLSAWTKDGKKLAEITDSSANSVKLPDDFARYLEQNGVSIISHNHPGSYPLSLADLGVAQGLNLDEIRAASKLYDYSMKPGKDGWPEADVIMDTYEKYFQKAYDRADYLVAVGKREWNDDLRRWVHNETLTGLSEELVLKYSRKDM